jgi:hypothetical protein
VTWGEESKDEMGSIGLSAVPHEEADLTTLNHDMEVRAKRMAHEKMMSDPMLAKKVMQMLAE